MGQFGANFGANFDTGVAGGVPRRIFLDVKRVEFTAAAASRIRLVSYNATFGQGALERETIAGGISEGSLRRKVEAQPGAAAGRVSHQSFHVKENQAALIQKRVYLKKSHGSMRLRVTRETGSLAGLRHSVNQFSTTLSKLIRRTRGTGEARGSSRTQASGEAVARAETEDDLTIIAQALEEEEE